MNNQVKLQEYNYTQLSDETVLSDKQMREVAELIYKTDPFIYPAIFGDGNKGIANALELIPELISKSIDSMFTLNNFFVASNQDKIIGVILWIDSTLNWDEGALVELARKSGIKLNEDNIEKASRECFYESYYEDYKSNYIYLVNVCVDENYRGQGIGSSMVESFIAQHSDSNMGLSVLADNTVAVSLYKKMGFVSVNQTEGFSIHDEKPKCLKMERTLRC